MARKAQLLRSTDFTTDHIEGWLARATPAQIAQGSTWYHRAYRTAKQIAHANGHTTAQAAGVLAALSPQVTWDRAVTLASLAARGEYVPHFRRQTAKAQRILTGEPPLDVLSGPKVRAFFRNIVDPDRNGPVTIDRWAMRIAFGEDLNQSLLEANGMYLAVSGLFLSVGRNHGLTGAQTQAITWVTMREARGFRFGN